MTNKYRQSNLQKPNEGFAALKQLGGPQAAAAAAVAAVAAAADAAAGGVCVVCLCFYLHKFIFLILN